VLRFWSVADVLAQLVGECQAIRAVRAEARRLVADEQRGDPAPAILIQGDVGTGKTLLAWLIHRSGIRAGNPFVTINCKGIPGILDTELFGFMKGPDPIRYPQGKRGLVEAAHRGTLFLDGVDRLPLVSQIKLERVIEKQKTLRLGDTRDREVDLRFISATRAHMPTEIDQGRFRSSLYRHLAAVTFELPLLSMRERDVILLAERVLERACRASGVPMKQLTADAEARLLRANWFGGVRELAETMERVTSLTRESIVTADMLATAGLPEDRAET
jgi:DNA-binding NtrC family response regulator